MAAGMCSSGFSYMGQTEKKEAIAGVSCGAHFLKNQQCRWLGAKYLKPEPMKNIPDSKHGIHSLYSWTQKAIM